MRSKKERPAGSRAHVVVVSAVNSLTNTTGHASEKPHRETIIKIEKRADPYARIDNKTLRDERLSWKATGLLAYLLSLPPDWHITLQHLCNAKSNGLHAYAVRSQGIGAAGVREI